LSGSGARGSINISAPPRPFPQNAASVSAVCCSATLHILLTLSLWRRNPSRCGLTTKPLPSHLRGEKSSPAPTAQNCTIHRAESRERRREQDKGRKDNSCMYHTDTHPWELSVVRAPHNLLDSHGSKSTILLHRPPDLARAQLLSDNLHKPSGPRQLRPALCLYPSAMWARSSVLSKLFCST